MADELNAFCREVGAPIEIKHFASLWKTFFTEDHPLQDLLFAMLRNRGIHILDNFPCFLTTAHTAAGHRDDQAAFKESVAEMQDAELLPRRAVAERRRSTPRSRRCPDARLGRDRTASRPGSFPIPTAPAST